MFSQDFTLQFMIKKTIIVTAIPNKKKSKLELMWIVSGSMSESGIIVVIISLLVIYIILHVT